MYLQNIDVLNIFKQVLPKIKINLNPILDNFNIWLSSTDRSFQQNVNRKVLELKAITKKMDLIGIYRISYPNNTECTLVKSAFSEIDHTIAYKATLNTSRETKKNYLNSISHSKIKLGTSKANYMISGRLNNTLLNRLW